MKERKMVKVVYINDNPGFTDGIPGANEKGRVITVSEEFAMKLVKNGRSNFFKLYEEEEKPKVAKKKK